MKTYRVLIFFLISTGTAISTSSCQDYLDAKPDQSLAQLQTLRDLQALLDHSFFLNGNFPGIGEEYADDYLLSSANWASLTEQYRQHYCFDHQSSRSNQWTGSYRAIFYANLVLDGLREVDDPSDHRYNRQHIEGSALFYRAYRFYHLAQVFAKHYNHNSAHGDLGIVLRRSSDIEEPLTRATLAETYSAILDDLDRACRLLPKSVQVATQPSRGAAYALLSRIYLQLGDFMQAGLYADSALTLQGTLIDYNSLEEGANRPFQELNPEVLFHSTMSTSPLALNRSIVRPELLQLYTKGDLRKELFYRANTDGTYGFKGAYDGATGTTMFNGISTAELILIKAECLAREGKDGESLTVLNTLLIKRWDSATFAPRTTANTVDALSVILIERRKELPFRGLRWFDLRRLSAEGRYSTPILRELDGTIYRLEATKIPSVAFKLPNDTIEEGGYQQN